MKIGKAKLGNSATKKYFKLEKGDNVFRILPPMGDLADRGIWAVYHKIHYGYVGLPDRTGRARMRPFVSPEVLNRATRMVEVADPAKERIEKIKQALSEAKDRGDTETVKQLATLAKTFNLDAKWYVNAMNLQGEIGLLKIPHKAKQALESEIQRLSQEGVDPLGVENGRYFVFQRTGEGRDTQYQVKVYKQRIEVAGLGMVEKDMPHALTEDVITRLETEAHKLNDLFKRPTAEQVARMVSEGPAAVEEILGRSQTNDMEDDGSEDDVDMPSAASSPVRPQASSAAAAAVGNASPVLPKSSVKIGTAATSSASTPTPSMASTPSQDQSPEEFLKSIGLG